MLNPRKDQLAAETMDRWYDFVQYAELTRSGEIVRRDMAAAGHELTTIYGWASMAPEDDVIAEIVRLECLVFSGHVGDGEVHLRCHHLEDHYASESCC